MIIDQLAPTASDNLTDEVPVEQGTATFKTTWQKILDLFRSNLNLTASDIPSTDGNVQSDIDGLQSDLSGKADLSAFKAFTVILPSASVAWSGNAIIVSNAYFLASGYSYIVSPASASFKEYGSAGIYADNVTVDGQMTFHCETIPSVNLTVQVQRVVTS